MRHTSGEGLPKKSNADVYQQQLSKRKEHAAILAAGYTPAKRRQEIVCITVFGLTFGYHVHRLSTFMLYNVFLNKALPPSEVLHTFAVCALYMVAAAITVDFFSGMLHWGCDTWGTVNTPLFGNYIRSFREHHVAPTAMAQHDMIETNGDNCLMCLPITILYCFRHITELHPATAAAPGSTVGVSYGWFAYIVSLLFFAALTNQIHKWTHTANPARLVRVMQSIQMIMPKRVHNIHHTVPFENYYCITTGWLNPLLEITKFWRIAEAAITMLTGAIPRADDMKWTIQR